MHPVRKRKLLVVFSSVFVLMIVSGLVMYALRQNISLFYTPSQLLNNEVTDNRSLRVGGMVVKGSIVRASKDLSVEFQLTDLKKTITVAYKGILPDLFREGQGIVAQGTWQGSQFKAISVLAKHDANYMPPEVASALKGQPS